MPVIIMTAYASQKTAIEAVNQGAFHYLIKHAKNDEIKMVVRNALDMKRVRTENVMLKKQLKKTSRSQDHHRQERRDAEGLRSRRQGGRHRQHHPHLRRERNRQGAHRAGDPLPLVARRAGPSCQINCGALPESLLESELFGHVKGSFTGAIKDKEGLFKVAQGGTFFLDEIGETSPTIQVKLLRVLQEREVIPVGGTNPIKVDVRLVAATNADLEKAIKQERFRADLYYRLNVIPVQLPPLRKRRDDIPLLVQHFLKKYNEDLPEARQKGITRGGDGDPGRLRLAGQRPRTGKRHRARDDPGGHRPDHARGRSRRRSATARPAPTRSSPTAPR